MIRKLLAEDRQQLVDIIDGTNNFNPEEKSVAVELIDEAIEKPNHEYYNLYVFENEGKILGYHCVGKRALTDGVFDLYWIVVGPNAQNLGVGKKLLEHSENFAKENNGRWILAETSSKDSYTATRNFYLRNNYSIVSQIKDFYSVGDNLIVFGKYLRT
ncbi:MAG: GNAT family N-acetyltransferase [Stygiobacter sp. RIFOXYC12_FULL_38_8]|nr:MAG: GNAT family N-acetyltransferase [Stygiobacter sp. GWC2_38_9]OGU84792.1 MAG: GNAT family N-acetyltransferase [Stygiobacter sp. RIFOXYA12_FULL_38_9]OGV08152.1 MAG: GNAT family N-acetyltransferase [Stygiobacter sp. RIFOXYB2_FULL_37_11]OGV11261.1 MAG: GNAT family N-acetyltransferase [Stygiobacter sp. RIFOXYA2_FULL_38_8]OGV15668.1 MAG: GNAT family N-acetyltransferase [Stygiobacter sp. RIFOXYC2_FULL_38_25]OGV22495.1 MAG: GNAT family N-acetyltransferase [Stygiobacter sp. RIFOXYC12_FULL_38_8]